MNHVFWWEISLGSFQMRMAQNASTIRRIIAEFCIKGKEAEARKMKKVRHRFYERYPISASDGLMRVTG